MLGTSNQVESSFGRIGISMELELPRVSVLLPCFNAEVMLEEALKSISSQTLTDFEVVIINDGCTDTSLDIINCWTDNDPRFKVFTQPHLGIVTALNHGLTHCSAPYIARMDSDDRCYPERLARQAAYLDSHPQVALVSCQVAGFPCEQVRPGFQIYVDWQNGLIEDSAIRRELFVESPFVHPSVMYRRNLVQALGGYQDHGWPEDYDLWLRMYLAGASFARIPEILLDWREHPERLTRTDTRYSVENFIRAKVNYLVQGPLVDRGAVIIWGAGMAGKRLSKHLQREGAPLVGFIDVDPDKIGGKRHGLPIAAADQLLNWWSTLPAPVLLVAVRARGAREIIRKQFNQRNLVEGRDWWSVA